MGNYFTIDTYTKPCSIPKINTMLYVSDISIKLGWGGERGERENCVDVAKGKRKIVCSFKEMAKVIMA